MSENNNKTKSKSAYRHKRLRWLGWAAFFLAIWLIGAWWILHGALNSPLHEMRDEDQEKFEIIPGATEHSSRED